MNNEKLKKMLENINRIYFDWALEINGERKRACNHFWHVFGNIFNYMSSSLELINMVDGSESEDMWQSLGEDYIKSGIELKEYFRLMQEYPEFREKELGTGGGYLFKECQPSLKNSIPSREYIKKASEMLKKD